MASGAPGHFTFAELGEELARLDRPWRRLWLISGVLGLVAGGGGAVLAFDVWRSGAGDLLSWLGPIFLLACLAPSALGFWALRDHPPPPTEAWISREKVLWKGPGEATVGFSWPELRHPLLLADFRPTGPRWRQDGSPRHIDFLVLRTLGTTRGPLPAPAAQALIAAARSSGFEVDDGEDVATRQGTVRLVRLVPPRR